MPTVMSRSRTPTPPVPSRRRQRALVRRRLATPPPVYPCAAFDGTDGTTDHSTDEDTDTGHLSGAGGTGRAVGAADPGSAKRRTRLRLALAALPLAVAVVLFVVIGPGSGPTAAPTEAPDQGFAAVDGSGADGPSLVPALTPGATGATMLPTAKDAAAAAGRAPGPVAAGRSPGQGADGSRSAVAGLDAESGDGAEGVDGDGADASTVPTPPAGHRLVALRVADPAALSLVAEGDRVDVVGMDGSVLAERLDVLQDRSAQSGSVLVLAVPGEASAPLAAAALSREVTVILSGEPEKPEEPEEPDNLQDRVGPGTGP